MGDREVRERLWCDLRAWHPDPGTLFVDEFDLGGLVRVDVAVVNGELWGYEIKSAQDTLRRLPTQVEIYSKVLDFATLVVAQRHHEHALSLLPTWWGVYVVTETPAEGVVLIEARKGCRNAEVDPLHLAQLLWREEALAELAERGWDRGVRSKPRRAVWERLVEVVEVPELQRVVSSRLTSRVGWRGSR